MSGSSSLSRFLSRLPALAAPGARGRLAERAAEGWLRRRGYRLVARNVRTAAGEIDLIVLDGETLCFVEVKARTGVDHGGALAAIDRRKRGRLARAAALYLLRRPHDGPLRFDVVTVERREDDWCLEHLPDAFEIE